MQKTIVFLKWEPTRNFYTDHFECWFKFSVTDSSLVGTPKERGSVHTIKVIMTDELMYKWGLAGAGEFGVTKDMIKAAFQSAEDYVTEQLKRGPLPEGELSPLSITTKNFSGSCPYKLSNILYPNETTFTVDIDEKDTSKDRVSVLFLAANPTDTTRLRLDEESRAIDQALRQAEFRDRFDIKQHWAVRVIDLQGLLLRHKPDIVHFSGHGGQSSEIILEDNTGNRHPVSVRALSALFSVLKDNIRCVVLNACYSEQQAQAIAEYIDCVIGMSTAIGDVAAISFATAFYQALGYGRDVKTAFDLGCIQVDMENLDEHDIPKLIATKGNPEETVFVRID